MSETMNDRFRVWFCGDESACSFAEQLWTALQEWDDIEDEGKCEDYNGLISWLAFGKEYQPFFAAHSHLLRPAFLQLYLSWTSANVLDRGDWQDVCKSYMLRAGFYQLLHLIAWICGGDAWARRVGPEIYRSYAETPEEIFKEFNRCQDQ
ncbi:MAG: hypothetical protein ACRBB0_15235 [Pelagimonas sp.]|uniref:hypothetical protein n=1 Tax=Pelagimonas sp. TaxID=2073170 RepID=UPI003D6AA2AB